MKGNLVKRSIYLLLVLSMLMIPTAGAASIEDYTDVPADYWGREALAYCVDNGYMQGVGENKMDPGGTLTLAEFVTILERITLTEDQRNAMRQTLIDTEDTLDNHWAAESMYFAQQTKITTSVNVSSVEFWDKPASRATMAVLADNIMRIQGQPIPNTDYIYTKIPDWSSIQGRQESEAILRVYKEGVIVGVTQRGDFHPDSTVTRATAAVIAMRIQDPSVRKPISNSTTNTTTTPETPSEGIFAPQTIHEGEGAQGRSPQPGDTYISASGEEVVLAIDPLTGILGWSQIPGGFMDYWSNGSCDDGHQLRGEGSMVYYEVDGIQMGGVLVKGQQGMFTQMQWLKIQDATYPSKTGTKDKQKDSTGLWQWESRINQWVWIGPSI